MDMEMNSLKPAEVFKFFAEINRIPRPSKKEERMIDYLVKEVWNVRWTRRETY